MEYSQQIELSRAGFVRTDRLDMCEHGKAAEASPKPFAGVPTALCTAKIRRVLKGNSSTLLRRRLAISGLQPTIPTRLLTRADERLQTAASALLLSI